MTYSSLSAWCRVPLIGLILFALAAPAFGLEVVTVPWLGPADLPHDVYSGGSVILQGTAVLDPGCVITDATWDPGDGSGPQTVPAGNPRVLELSHTYAGLDGQPFVAVLSVTDSCGNTETDTFRVTVRAKTLDVEVNMAIDRGLWHLYKRMTLSSSGGVNTGIWFSGHSAAATASAVQAFEISGHLETGDRSKDPYVDVVARGLAHVMTELTSVNISVQPAGNPDANANGIGLEAAAGYRPIYVGGQVIDAIVASGTPAAVAVTGGTSVLGRTYGDIVQDMMDTYAWGQVDAGSFYRGGWRYFWNSQSDNSACQWAAIGGLAAEGFGVTIPGFVKTENQGFWIVTSQTFDGSGTGIDGRFGYAGTSPLGTIYALNETASGIVQLNFDGVTSDQPRFVSAEKFLANNWTDLVNLYGMFAVAKAFRLAQPLPIDLLDGQFDWYRAEVATGDPVDGLARQLVDSQQVTGNRGEWDGWWVADDLATAWAIIILSPTIFCPPPTALCDAEPEVTGEGELVEFDASASFHQDPERSIVSYEWDFDGDGTFDATGPVVTHTFNSIGTFSVKLRVTDDADPPCTDTISCPVVTVPPPIPPNSDPNGPYIFCIGRNEPFVLDGTRSSDPDSPIVSYEWDFNPQPLDHSFDDATTPTVDLTAFFTALGPGTYDVALRVTDDTGAGAGGPLVNTDFTTVQVFEDDCPIPNFPPDCSEAAPSLEEIWPPNHKFVPISITGVTDPDGDDVTITIDSIFQDEPLETLGDGSFEPDGEGVGTATAKVRAERSGTPQVPGNGRVYHIAFTADDGNGGTCSGTVTVCVPHDQSPEHVCVDEGPLYDSTGTP